MVLKDTELEKVAGGFGVSKEPPKAVCKACGCDMEYLETIRIGGGSTGVFRCINSKCSDYHVKKNNLGEPVSA